MGKIEENLIKKALEKHRVIYPCGKKQELNECFTSEKDSVIFWYNTGDNSTHVEFAKANMEPHRVEI